MVSDLNGRYRLARERMETLRAEAARERLARSIPRPDRADRPSLRTAIGDVFIRIGRAVSGDRRAPAGARADVSNPASLEERGVIGRLGPDHGRFATGRAGALSASSASTAGPVTARMLRGVRRDRLDRLARDLDRLARDLAAGESLEF